MMPHCCYFLHCLIGAPLSTMYAMEKRAERRQHEFSSFASIPSLPVTFPNVAGHFFYTHAQKRGTKST
jgi:hypothetical protein